MSCFAALISDWIRRDDMRWRVLAEVRSLDLPDCWVAAGFVRNLVWDKLHGRLSEITSDVDVIWFDRAAARQSRDHQLENMLRTAVPGIKWSVKNQARMHLRNGDEPYASSEDALRYWPETATAVAVRRTETDDCEMLSPFGLDDLFALRLRPAGEFAKRKRGIFDQRVASKAWLATYPKLERVG